MGVVMTDNNDIGAIESIDGAWYVSWDHTTNARITYNVEDREDGGTYVCHFDNGRWVCAPSYMPTVDMERVVPTTGEFDTLLIALNKASGREHIAGVYINDNTEEE